MLPDKGMKGLDVEEQLEAKPTPTSAMAAHFNMASPIFRCSSSTFSTDELAAALTIITTTLPSLPPLPNNTVILSRHHLATMTETRMKWVPLESNPELFTSWCSSMGMDTSKFAFHDIYGTDPDLLAMVPQPVAAVLLLFPITPSMEKLRETENEAAQPTTSDSDILWFKQTIGNACGTIGLLHALANSSASDAIKPDSPLDTLFKKARSTQDVDERADILVNSKELQTVHEATASQGQSQAPEDLDNVILHFVCFVRSRDGELIELDGSGGRKGPIKRGKKVGSQEDLLPVAVDYVKENYMALNPEEVNFNLIALGPSFD